MVNCVKVAPRGQMTIHVKVVFREKMTLCINLTPSHIFCHKTKFLTTFKLLQNRMFLVFYTILYLDKPSFIHFRSPSPLVIITTENDTNYSAFPVNRFEDDATSLYEYPDQPNSTIVNAQVPVEAHRHKTGPNGITYLQVNLNKIY